MTPDQSATLDFTTEDVQYLSHGGHHDHEPMRDPGTIPSIESLGKVL